MLDLDLRTQGGYAHMTPDQLQLAQPSPGARKRKKEKNEDEEEGEEQQQHKETHEATGHVLPPLGMCAPHHTLTRPKNTNFWRHERSAEITRCNATPKVAKLQEQQQKRNAHTYTQQQQQQRQQERHRQIQHQSCGRSNCIRHCSKTAADTERTRALHTHT